MFDQLPNQVQGFAYRPGESANAHLWDKLVLSMAPCLGVGGRDCPDLSPSRYASSMLGLASAFTMTGSPIGPALRFNGNVSQQWAASSWGLPTKVGEGNSTTQPGFTIQAYFKYVHKGSATNMCLFRSDQPGTFDTTFYGYGLMIEANADRAFFFTNQGVALEADMIRQWNLTNASISAQPQNLTPDNWHHLIVTFSPDYLNYSEFGQIVMMCLDGRRVYPAAPASEQGPFHSNSKNARCGSMLGATTPDFEIALLNIWNRRLAWREIDYLSADPLMMFRRRGLVVGKAGAAATRIVSIGGTAIRRASVAVAG
jgi:hypothetical protein